MQVELHPEAQAELRAAALWYDELSEGAGDELIAEFNAALERVIALPLACLTWPGVPERARPIRRAKIHRFPYAFAFEVGEETIFVLAVAHERRRPLYWYSRAT